MGRFGGLIGLICAALVSETLLAPYLEEKMRNVESFFLKLDDTIDKAFKRAKEIERELKSEIRRMNELKIQTEEIKTLVGLDNNTPKHEHPLIQSVERLTANFKSYQKHHAKDAEEEIILQIQKL